MAAAAILKNRKSPYLRNGLIDLREIWHGDAYWACEPDRKLKFHRMDTHRQGLEWG